MAPPKIAAELVEALKDDAVVAEASAAGPFLNMRFPPAALAEEIIRGVLESRAPYGAEASSAESERIVIDFSSPNIAKPFHVGHLRSTVIGAALTRIHRHLGHEVVGINHLGDWGMPFAKMMTAWLRFGDEAEFARAPMQHMFELYKRYSKEAADDPSLDKEAAARFRALESGEDNEERRMWTFLRDKSLEAFQGPYERLGVTFDHITGESFFEDKMEPAMARVAAAGVLTKSDGAEVVDLKDQGIKVPCLLRKSDGATLHHTRDLAAAFYRDEQYNPTRILYVVGSEQKLHFTQLRGVLSKMGEPLAKKIEHVPFGLVLSQNDEGRWEKFSSRGGNAIFLDEILDEAVKSVRAIMAEKSPDLAEAEADEIAESVGVSAIVFNDLKNSRIKDVKFDWTSMLSFEGETGPYVQYAIARLSGILSKAEAESGAGPLEAVHWSKLDDASPVLLKMMEFGPSLQRTARDSEPSVLTSFVIDLAGTVHSYLREHRVIDAEPELRKARIALVHAAKQLLTTGLSLLGVAAPERM